MECVGWRLALVISCLLSGQGRAGDAVIAVGACADGSAGAFTRELRAAVARAPGAKVLSEEETVAALGGVPRGSMADVQRLIASARFDLYDQGAFDRAERALKAALDDLWLLPPSEARWEDLREVQTFLAKVYLKLERPREAEQQLGRVYRVEPDYGPDPNTHPPSFRAFAASVRERVVAEAIRNLSVGTRPAGLPVYVEGRLVGSSPVNLRVSAGEYRVEALFAGGRGMARMVGVSVGGASVELEEGFEGAIHPHKGPCLATGNEREARLAALIRLAGLLKAERMVSARLEEPRPSERYLVVSLLEAVTGQETREAKVKVLPVGVPVGGIARLAEFIATGEASEPVEAIRGAVKVEPRVEAPAAVVKAEPEPGLRPTGLVVGGAGAAGLLASGYFFLQASGAAAEQGRICSRTSCGDRVAEYERLEAVRSANNTLGLISGVAGLVTMGVGVYLALPEEPAKEAAAKVVAGPGGVGARLRF
ncbi:MAG: PEGA domain-containing protein [Myxococcales bacterium]|nr:PEGA domain-containing protein [Myxococcales bacterium]